MELVLRTAAIFFFLWLFFRIAGKRSLARITTFDFIILLVISEATQQALVGSDNSVTGAMTVVATFLFLDIALSLLKQKSPTADKILDSVPVILVQDGRLLKESMEKERVDEAEIMAAARQHGGIRQLGDIHYAVLEQNGVITVIPRRNP